MLLWTKPNCHSLIFHSSKLDIEMNISEITKKLGLSESKHLVRKAAELRRAAEVQFDSSIVGVGEICKAIICLETVATRYQERFLSSLLTSRRASADFTWPVFTSVAFYLCAKRNKDLCFDVFGTSKEKKDSSEVKGN